MTGQKNLKEFLRGKLITIREDNCHYQSDFQGKSCGKRKMLYRILSSFYVLRIGRERSKHDYFSRKRILFRSRFFYLFWVSRFPYSTEQLKSNLYICRSEILWLTTRAHNNISMFLLIYFKLSNSISSSRNGNSVNLFKTIILLIQWDKTFQFSNIFLDWVQIKFLLSRFAIGFISCKYTFFMHFLKNARRKRYHAMWRSFALNKSKTKREFLYSSTFCNFPVNSHRIC